MRAKSRRRAELKDRGEWCEKKRNIVMYTVKRFFVLGLTLSSQLRHFRDVQSGCNRRSLMKRVQQLLGFIEEILGK